jgi:hypothetical protein
MSRDSSILGVCFESIVVLAFVNVFWVTLTNIYFFLDSYKVAIPYLCIKVIEKYIKLNNINDSQEIIKTKLSTLHAIVLFLANSTFLYNQISLDIWKTCLLYSLIYNVSDMVYLYFSDMKIKHQLFIHHFILICCVSPIIYEPLYFLVEPISNYNTLVATNFLCELTTIPLNIAWILHVRNNNSFQFKIWSLITIILYIPFRVVLTTYLSYKFYLLETNFKYFQFILSFLNYYWFYKMFQKVYRINNTNKVQ